ncbi:unnamed protein product, partial [Closterium sp. NIES-54]
RSISRVIAAVGRRDYNEYADRNSVAGTLVRSTQSREDTVTRDDARKASRVHPSTRPSIVRRSAGNETSENTINGNRSTCNAGNGGVKHGHAWGGHEWGVNHWARFSAVAGAVAAGFLGTTVLLPPYAIAATTSKAAAIAAAQVAAAAAEAAAEAAAYAAEAAAQAAEAAAEAAEAAAEAAAAAAEAVGAVGEGAAGGGFMQNAVWNLASLPDLPIVDLKHLPGVLSSLPVLLLPSSFPLSLSLALPLQAQLSAPPIALENAFSGATVAAISVTAGSAASAAAATPAASAAGAAVPVAAAAAASLGEWQDPVMGLVTLLGSLIWVRLFDELARRDLIERKLSRKLVHITTGLLFMLFWPLFSTGFNARFFASAVPLINATRLLLLGLGLTRNEGMVKAMSREGSSSLSPPPPLAPLISPAHTPSSHLPLLTVSSWAARSTTSSRWPSLQSHSGAPPPLGAWHWRSCAVEMVGSAVEMVGSAVEMVGSAVEMVGSAVEMVGTAVEMVGCAVEMVGCAVEMVGCAVEMVGSAVEMVVVESLPISDKLDDNLTVPLSTVLFGMLLLQL